MANVQTRHTVIGTFSDKTLAENTMRELRKQPGLSEDIRIVSKLSQDELSKIGVSAEEVRTYQNDVERGRELLIVTTASKEAAELVRDAIDRYNADETGNKAGAEPLSADGIRRSREYASDDPEAHDQGESLQAIRRARVYPG